MEYFRKVYKAEPPIHKQARKNWTDTPPGLPTEAFGWPFGLNHRSILGQYGSVGLSL